MGLNATSRRRWFGAGVLVAALAMLVAGQTVLQGRLSNLAFVVYWLVCFTLTGLAVLIAFYDMQALQHRSRNETRDLLESTLQNIQREAKSKPRPPGPK